MLFVLLLLAEVVIIINILLLVDVGVMVPVTFVATNDELLVAILATSSSLFCTVCIT